MTTSGIDSPTGSTGQPPTGHRGRGRAACWAHRQRRVLAGPRSGGSPAAPGGSRPRSSPRCRLSRTPRSPGRRRPPSGSCSRAREDCTGQPRPQTRHHVAGHSEPPIPVTHDRARRPADVSSSRPHPGWPARRPHLRGRRGDLASMSAGSSRRQQPMESRRPPRPLSSCSPGTARLVHQQARGCVPHRVGQTAGLVRADQLAAASSARSGAWHPGRRRRSSSHSSMFTASPGFMGGYLAGAGVP